MKFSNLQDLGIVVTEFAGMDFDNHYFIRSACSGNKYPSLLEITWRNQHKWVVKGRLKPPRADYCKIRIPDKPYTLHLVGFSTNRATDFYLDDLHFPFKIAGLILLVKYIYWQEFLWWESASNYALFQWQQRQLGIKGGIGWVEKIDLPIVVGPVQNINHPISTDNLHEILALKPQVPVLPYYVDFDSEREGYELGFTYEYTQRVLSALVNQIEMRGL